MIYHITFSCESDPDFKKLAAEHDIQILTIQRTRNRPNKCELCESEIRALNWDGELWVCIVCAIAEVGSAQNRINKRREAVAKAQSELKK